MHQLTTIEFMGSPVSIIDHDGKKWMIAEQVGICLGYAEANARIGVQNLYNRHKDEFTEADSTVINLITVDGKNREVRVFSETGCIKLGFFANTPIAKDFRTFAARELAAKGVTPMAVAMPVVSSPAFDLMACNMAKLAEGMDTLLRQNNRSEKYVALLEMNQKGHVKVTEAIRKEVFELYGQGMPQASIARLLRISASTVNQLIKGTYIAKTHLNAPSYAAQTAVVDAAIEKQLKEAKEVALGSVSSN